MAGGGECACTVRLMSVFEVRSDGITSLHSMYIHVHRPLEGTARLAEPRITFTYIQIVQWKKLAPVRFGAKTSF